METQCVSVALPVIENRNAKVLGIVGKIAGEIVQPGKTATPIGGISIIRPLRLKGLPCDG